MCTPQPVRVSFYYHVIMREAARQHKQACTRHPASPKHPPQKTPKTPSKTPPQDTFILRHVHDIKHHKMQRYALKSSRPRMQARNLAPNTNSGPDSAHRPAKPPPPIFNSPEPLKLQRPKSNITARNRYEKVVRHFRNNNRAIKASSGAETALFQAPVEAALVASGPVECFTGVVGMNDVILREISHAISAI